MGDRGILRPPSALLNEHAPPNARTIVAEVRSDASLPFDPQAAPAELLLNNVAFGAIIQWRVDVSWSQAQAIQSWLNGRAAGRGTNREQALKNFLENLRVGPPPGTFLEYVGTYLTTGISNARYTVLLGMRSPVGRDAYRSAFQTGLATLQAGPPGWPDELVSFLKMILNEPTSHEEFLTLASNMGDLSTNGPPLVQALLR
jgi:hypothetical protein